MSTSTPLSANGQKGFAPILIVLILALVASVGGFLVYSNYSNKRTKVDQIQQTQSTPAPKKTEEASNSADTTNWKTYRNEKYKFEFKYPKSWILEQSWRTRPAEHIEDSLCCLSMDGEYEKLPTTYNPNEYMGTEIGINTKADFIRHKKLVDDGKVPPDYESRFIKALKIGEINAVQRFTFPMGSSYRIETTLFTHQIRINIYQELPVKSIAKPLESHRGWMETDMDKSLIRLDEITDGKFNQEIEGVVREHNTVLSTFKFTQ